MTADALLDLSDTIAQHRPPREAWPRAVQLFVGKIHDSWTFEVWSARGLLELGGLSEDTDGEGHRSRITRTVTADSYTVRVAHQLLGLRGWAMWARPDGAGWSGHGGELLSVCQDLDCATIAPVVHALAYPAQLKISDLAAIVDHEPLELM